MNPSSPGPTGFAVVGMGGCFLGAAVGTALVLGMPSGVLAGGANVPTSICKHRVGVIVVLSSHGRAAIAFPTQQLLPFLSGARLHKGRCRDGYVDSLEGYQRTHFKDELGLLHQPEGNMHPLPLEST